MGDSFMWRLSLNPNISQNTVQENKVGAGDDDSRAQEQMNNPLQSVQNFSINKHDLTLSVTFFSVCRRQDHGVDLNVYCDLFLLVSPPPLQEDVPPSPLRWTTAPATRPASSPSPSAAR